MDMPQLYAVAGCVAHRRVPLLTASRAIAVAPRRLIAPSPLPPQSFRLLHLPLPRLFRHHASSGEGREEQGVLCGAGCL